MGVTCAPDSPSICRIAGSGVDGALSVPLGAGSFMAIEYGVSKYD